jgi:hypothetical protein
MQRLEVSSAVRHIYASLGSKGLKNKASGLVTRNVRLGGGGPRMCDQRTVTSAHKRVSAEKNLVVISCSSGLNRSKIV